MRRATILALLLAVLVLLAAGPATAGDVTNERVHKYDMWVSIEDADFWVNAIVEQYAEGAWFGVDLYVDNECDETTADYPDWYEIKGEGSVHTVHIGAFSGPDRFTTGHAIGVFDEWGSLSYELCDGTTGTEVDLFGETFTMDMEGDDKKLSTWVEQQHWVTPGGENYIEVARGVTRGATGWIDISYPGPWETSIHGGIGEGTILMHWN